ncbi:MAG: ThiF family adenylyltransferase [bacterium]|nr:ThiF family adenylyltransferase [bacterium]
MTDDVLKETPRRDSHPLLFNLAKDADAERVRALKAKGEVMQVIDRYESQLKELFAIDNPPLALSAEFEASFAKHLASLVQKGPLSERGIWAYFPWILTLVHILPDKEFQKVRTARNKNLITEKEQKKFYDSTVGIAGLSVGNSVALAITLQGGARHMKLADHDMLELSNLNRIRSGIDSLGVPKVELTARQIYLLNPYAQVELFPEGLTDSNMNNFFDGLDIIIDEIDNLIIKYRIREEAKKRKIPVLMAADNADSGVIDI